MVLGDGVVMLKVTAVILELVVAFAALAVVLAVLLPGRLDLPLGKMVFGGTMGVALGSALQALRIVVFEKIVILVGIIVQEDAVLLGVGSVVL